MIGGDQREVSNFPNEWRKFRLLTTDSKPRLAHCGESAAEAVRSRLCKRGLAFPGCCGRPVFAAACGLADERSREGSIGKKELQQRRRFVQLWPIMTS